MLLASLIAVLLCTAADPTFEPCGSWRVQTGSGPATLFLETDEAGQLLGTFEAAHRVCTVQAELLTDEDDESSVEGSWNCGSGGAEFELYPDDEGAFELMVVPVGADGIPRSDLVEFWSAIPGEPRPVPTGESTLVGVWSTQVVMNSPEGSIATQMFMEIRADGTLHDLGSRSVAGGSDWGGDTGLFGAGESANWRSDGEVLEISYRGSPWVPLARYEIRPHQLYLRWHDGGTALWHRESD